MARIFYFVNESQFQCRSFQSIANRNNYVYWFCIWKTTKIVNVWQQNDKYILHKLPGKSSLNVSFVLDRFPAWLQKSSPRSGSWEPDYDYIHQHWGIALPWLAPPIKLRHSWMNWSLSTFRRACVRVCVCFCARLCVCLCLCVCASSYVLVCVWVYLYKDLFMFLCEQLTCFIVVCVNVCDIGLN